MSLIEILVQNKVYEIKGSGNWNFLGIKPISKKEARKYTDRKDYLNSKKFYLLSFKNTETNITYKCLYDNIFFEKNKIMLKDKNDGLSEGGLEFSEEIKVDFQKSHIN